MAASDMPAGTRHDQPIIALVASAGGVDAISRILAGLPQSLEASVVVLIHQEPDRESRLVELLDHVCALPVVEAQDGVRLAAGEVTVVPAGKHMLVQPGNRTALIASGAAPPSRPSADLLLATLATAVAARALAVVLSGGGHDGATGATAVHVCGGVVIATDEKSSRSYSMPLAAIQRGDAVDHIVSLDEVAGLLVALVGQRA
jgi:two-component system chemotaxis response regulator CheB